MANKRLQKAHDLHQKWLEDRGLSRKQIKEKRDSRFHPIAFPDLSVESNVPLSNGFAKSGFVNTPMSKRFTEKPEVRAEIEKKAMSIAPAYNKGAAQYINPNGKDHKHMGKKTSAMED